MHPDRQLDLLPGQVAEHPVERPEPREGAEDEADHVLRLLIGVEDGLAGRPAHVADRQRDGQVTALGLGQLPDSIRCRIRYSSCSYANPVVMPTLMKE